MYKRYFVCVYEIGTQGFKKLCIELNVWTETEKIVNLNHFGKWIASSFWTVFSMEVIVFFRACSKSLGILRSSCQNFDSCACIFNTCLSSRIKVEFWMYEVKWTEKVLQAVKVGKYGNLILYHNKHRLQSLSYRLRLQKVESF